ncbi:threonine-phosphate decarboxylase CobD [Paraburkholderia kururiensis]|uniref:threonine-phosphate decarboxylase n=1 Tax=Paraburkholderia kururiensis TaxID=984307 RepID=A0ABZ0WUP5_9BURK|nr:threonine-phosphate decarboxylase CobD [Paraburkholderia kururiensis]WQD81137.1 threonine-phosphate decarboxylase CobD [Paraburkholderia kururiensis]
MPPREYPAGTPRISHGGNLHEAARRYGIPHDAWLDLSTGINPHGYPVPPVPADAWRRLPDEDDPAFAASAARYYGAPDAAHVQPTAGSQAAIRALPALLPRATVAIAALTYGEYAPAFAGAGHEVTALDTSWDTLPAGIRHVMVANPNNPTAVRLDAAVLLRWHAQLVARGGTLVVDEAFADSFADAFTDASGDNKGPVSLAPHVAQPGLVVLRSPGKFFGLAGARCGFVLAQPALLHELAARLGAWTVSGPARHAVMHAFADIAWQTRMRAHLADESARLTALLRRHGFAPHSTPLFTWTADPRAEALHHALAQRGIWTRLFRHPANPHDVPSIRIGLPADADEWQRLEQHFAASVDVLALNR